MRGKSGILAVVVTLTLAVAALGAQPLAGKPLIQHTIHAAQKAKLVDRIIVSTDDEKIAEVAKKCGAEVPFIRPKELSQDNTTTEDALKHAILWLKENENYNVNILVFMQITDLFKRPEYIEKAVRMLLDDEKLDSVFVAYPDYKHYWKKDGARFIRLTKESYGPRQFKERIYREDTGLGCATRARLITESGRRLGDNVGIIENNDFMIDIHTELDLWIANKLLDERPEFKKYRI